MQCANFRQVVGQSTGALLNLHFGEILSLHFAKDSAGIRLDHRSKAEDGLPLADESLFANLSSPIVKLAEKILMDSLKVLKIEVPSRNIWFVQELQLLRNEALETARGAGYGPRAKAIADQIRNEQNAKFGMRVRKMDLIDRPC